MRSRQESQSNKTYQQNFSNLKETNNKDAEKTQLLKTFQMFDKVKKR